MKDSIGIILEGVPNSISTERLKEDLKCIEGVRLVLVFVIENAVCFKNKMNIENVSNLFSRSVHNLNVWSLTAGWPLLSVHIIIGMFLITSFQSTSVD